MERPNGNVVVVTVAVVFMFVVGGAYWVSTGAENPSEVIKTVIATLTPTLAVIVTLIKVNQVKADSEALRNGEMESKIENVVHKVINKDEESGPGSGTAL